MSMNATIRVAAVLVALGVTATTYGQSNLSATDKYAWGENVGWLNWRDADGALAGVQIHPTFLSGHVWGENIGWIHLGDGSPGLGDSYGNVDGSDTGVNIDGTGDLSGLGWGEHIGWVNFDTGTLGSDRARFDLAAGRFRGYAWGENIGWINLDDSTRFVGLGPFPDECFLISSAISEGVWPFDTTEATTGDDPISAALCPGTFLNEFSRDIWFEYVPTDSGLVAIGTCGSDFDTDLAVYEGACEALTPVGCNGDACNTTGGIFFPYASRLELEVNAGESYFVRVGGFNAFSFGTGTLTITYLGPIETPFVRSDCNADGATNIADAITTLDALFGMGSVPCTDACDANEDTAFNIADAIFTLSYLFVSGAPNPSAPFPACDVLPPVLGCDRFAGCP